MTVIAMLAFSAASFASSWDIDSEHSRASFKVRHIGISSVSGFFGKVTGVVNVDEADLSKSTVKASIDTNSLSTGIGMRDKDLKGTSYFDTAKYPEMTFVSTAVAPDGEGRLKLTGDLTLHGVTHPVVLEVKGPTTEAKDSKGVSRRMAVGTTKINRKEFGVSGGWAGGVIGDEVAVTIEVELVSATH